MAAKRERYTPSDVGPSPLDWGTPYLKDVSSLITNGFVGTATPFYTETGGVTYLYGTNVRENRIDLTGARKVTLEFHKAQSKTALMGGDLLTVQSGHIGTTAVVPDELTDSNCHALIVTRLIKDRAYPQFLSYYINSHIGKARMRGLEVGSTILHINTKDLKKFRIPLPPLAEQMRIAEILSTWDRAIETTEKLIENSQKRKKALMQHLLTGKRRLPGFGEEWIHCRFHDVFERINRKNTVGNENVLTISGRLGLVNQKRFFNKSVASKDLSGYTLLYKGDFAYNKSYSKGYPYGAIKPLQQYESGIVSSLYLCFRLIDQQQYSHEFMRHFFEHGMFDKEIYAIAQEGARNHGLLNVSAHDFFNAKLCIPLLEEQRAIAAVINTAEKEMDNLSCQLELLQRQQKGLMQQLLTGKKRVSGAKAA